jgi:murein L,D-transpeptidase YcbB/YkuD
VQLAKDMRFPVIILYMTAWTNDKGVIDFRPDIYQRDAKMMNALKNVNQYVEKI